MTEDKLDAIARRLQLIEEDLAVLRRSQEETKRALEERLERVEEAVGLAPSFYPPYEVA